MEILYILCCGGGISLIVFCVLLFIKHLGANSGYSEFPLDHDNYFGLFGRDDS